MAIWSCDFLNSALRHGISHHAAAQNLTVAIIETFLHIVNERIINFPQPLRSLMHSLQR